MKGDRARFRRPDWVVSVCGGFGKGRTRMGNVPVGHSRARCASLGRTFLACRARAMYGLDSHGGSRRFDDLSRGPLHTA